MTTGQWRIAWDLLRAARELPAAAQRDFVQNASQDPAVVEHVLLMLDEEEELPAPKVGQQFGRYHILSQLGAGGMGEVFAARDTDLDRTVALKFLNRKVAILPFAVERLIHEAKAASALNHPNIVTVYEVLRSEAGPAIVTERVDGVSLREKCASPQPVPLVAAWGRQLAQALLAAHAAGIVHRDIKPENIILRPDGVIKLLDFGLARRDAFQDSAADLAVGTVGYISPEQLRGLPPTIASDIYALGVVLYELAAGTLPDPSARRPLPSRAFDTLVAAALHPDPAARPSAETLAAALARIASPSPRRFALWAAATLAAALFGATAFYLNTPTAEPFHARIVPLTNYLGSETEPQFSPDGARLAFTWTGENGVDRDIYVKDIAGGEPLRVTPGDANFHAPAWSPDGQSLALLRGNRGFAQDVVILPARGGPPRIVGRISDPQGYRRPVAWWPDGQSLVVREVTPQGIRLQRLFLSGNTARLPLTTPPPDHFDSMITPAPDYARFAYVRSNARSAAICLLPVTGAAPDLCIHETSTVRGLAWQSDSKALLYADEKALWRLTLDGVRVRRHTKLLDGEFSQLAADPAGQRFAFTRTLSDMNLRRATGKDTRKILTSSAEDSEPAFSPDGTRIVFRSTRSGAYELWVANPDGANPVRITNTGGHLGSARWSPDGKWIVFDGHAFTTEPGKGSPRSGIYVVPAAGGPVRWLTGEQASGMVPSWSRDGRWIYYSGAIGSKAAWMKVPLEGGAPEKLMDGPIFEGVESADGKYFYHTRLFQRPGIWRLPVGGGEATLLPGTEGVRDRHWEYHPEGVYFVDGKSELVVRFYSFATGRVSPVAPFPPRLAIGPRAITVSPDGKTIIYCQEDLTLGDIMLLERDP